MARIAMKTCSYLPDFPFYYMKEGKPVLTDKTNLYPGDDFCMTMTLFDFDGQYVCWVGMDMISCPEPFYRLMKEGIDEVTDQIDDDHFFVNGTHTHSGPVFSRSGACGPGSALVYEDLDDLSYHCRDLIRNMFLELKDKLRPFEAEIRVTQIQGAYSNRNSLEGPCDKAATLIRFIDAESHEPIGQWFCMNCHSTMIFPHNEHLCSDLVGHVWKNVQKHDGIPTMPNCGCQGDTSTRLTRHRTGRAEDDYRELIRIANEVTGQVNGDTSPFEPIVIDRFERTSYEVSFSYYTALEITRRKIAKLEKEIEEDSNPDGKRLKKDALRAIRGREGITSFSGTLKPACVNMGELKWAIIPGELVASLGLQIVRHQPHDHRMVACYINSKGLGYLVEREEYGKNFESLSSIVPVGIPEVLTSMAITELDQFDLLNEAKE